MERVEVLQTVRRDPGTPSTSQSNAKCTDCGGTGWIYPQQQTSAGVRRCACLLERITESRFQLIAARFRDCSLDNYEPIDEVQKQAVRAIQKDPGDSFFLHGMYGRGKTHLEVAQYKIIAKSGKPCLFRSMSDLLHEIQSAELRGEPSVTLERVKYENTFHLFIDDIDKFKPSEFRSQAIFDLIDGIYRRNLSVTITSNLSVTGLTQLERLEPAVLRRIDDMCIAVQV